jgi:Glycosyl hydrolase catalytic core
MTEIDSNFLFARVLKIRYFLSARLTWILSMIAAVFLLAACGAGGGGDNAGANATGGSQASSSGSGSGASAASGASAPAGASSPAPASGTGNTTDTPLAVIAPSGSVFYGMNGHVNRAGPYQTTSLDTQLAQLKDLGVTLYRNDVGNVEGAQYLASVAQKYARSGVTVYPVILQQLDFPDEDTAYQASYTLAQQIVNVQRYAWYEVTNELAPECLVGWVDGVRSTDFNNSCFQIARGVIRGLIAGIKSVDPVGKIIIGGNTWMHYGFDVMLANGTQPDGTSGHPVVTWDITAWHWYSEQGDITNACGGTGCHNVLAVLQAFGKPIWLTEFGVRPWYGNDQQIASYMVGDRMMAEFVALASQYDVQAIQVYQLYDDEPGGEGDYGLFEDDGKTQKPVYTTFRDFVAAHPK